MAVLVARFITGKGFRLLLRKMMLDFQVFVGVSLDVFINNFLEKVRKATHKRIDIDYYYNAPVLV